LARADYEESRRAVELAHRLEQIHLTDDIRVKRLGRRLPRRVNEALRRQMDDVVRPCLLEHHPDRKHVAKIRLDEHHAVAQRLAVLPPAPPPNRSEHLGATLNGVLSKVTAHESGDAGDQNPHRGNTTAFMGLLTA